VAEAGGIGDDRAFAAVLGMGAAGVRAGTGFVATTESGAHPAYKQAVADAAADSTEITNAFEPAAQVIQSWCAAAQASRG
jgi:nitronate monooxygenase